VALAPVVLGVVVASSARVDASPAAGEKQTLVVCSPGSPGKTDEAQPRMDAFAGAVSAKAGVQISAVYDPTNEGGVSRFASAGLGLVSLPFFLQHEKELALHPRLAAVAKGRPALERWGLVVAKGKVKTAADLANFTISTNLAFSPGFVRGVVIGSLGPLPATAKITQSSTVLSALRHAADGQPVAVIVDGTTEASLTSLPFAEKLEVVAHSPPAPAGLVVTVDAKLPDKAWAGIEKAMLGMSSDKAAATALDAIQMTGFVALDAKALDAVRKAFADAGK
jgi:ABC-type phosphate/phosphonate transport system substrate-binding protein